MSASAIHPRPGLPLISFICETDADLMPHFVRWYRRLGVERFHLIVHGPWDEADLAALAAMPGVEITRRLDGPFCRTLKCDAITEVARRHLGEWILIADADELLELPAADIGETIAALEAAGIDELYGALVQRVAADGSLPDVGPDTDLDATFPMYHVGLCEDMGLEVPAWKSKYPLARVGPDFVYQRGNHLPGNFRSVAHVPMRSVLHHFKWRKRLYEAFARERGEGTNFREMDVYRTWLEAHGRLPMGGAKPLSRAALEAEGLLRMPTPDEFRTLDALKAERAVATGRRLRVGYVTFELGGPGSTNGGIATAMSALAKLQAAHGISVEVFYCPFQRPRDLPPLWFEYWATFGVKLHYIPRYSPAEDRNLDTLEFGNAILEAVRREGRFDLLQFHDTQGYAAPFAMLKDAGLEFTDTTLAITTHGGTRWHNENNRTPWDEAAYRLELIGQRLCDAVVSPSEYLIGWNRDLAALPGRTAVLPNVLEPESKSFARPDGGTVRPRCLAFFGRVEVRKGFDLFVAALRELAAKTDFRPEVLVLGRFGTGFSPERFAAETAELPFRIVHHSSLNPQQALRLLKDRQALAVMPSRLENSPYVAYEAMENGLPFLVSFTGGTAELVHPDDRSQAELPLDPAAMAARFAEALGKGLRPARLVIDPLEIEVRNLVAWRELAEARGRFGPRRGATSLVRRSLDDWRSTAGLDPREAVALIPDGVEIDERILRMFATVLAIDPAADAVEGHCRVVDGTLGTSTSSSHVRAKANRRELAVVAGPQPIVVRAGVLAAISARIPAEAGPNPPEETYGSILQDLVRSGSRIVALPVETHVHRMPSGLEQRSLGTRLWLPVGRRPATERPPRTGTNISQMCALLKAEPYVSVSMFSSDTPFGPLSLFPEALADRPSLHLVTLGSSLFWAIPAMLPRRLAEARERWPSARFRVLASDERELDALRAAGLPALLGNLNMFVDERTFHPGYAGTAGTDFDALCVGAMEVRENHHLARFVPSIGIVHNRYEGMEDVGDEVRRLLPQATYLTDAPDRPEGFFYPSESQLAAWMCRASTGLALSQSGGTCPSTVQFLLCGTPVVTVPNVGGRDHFLRAPWAITAEATPRAVAAAVAELKARGLTRREVHEATRAMLVEARARFLEDVNRVMLEEFGGAERIEDLSSAIGGAYRYRRSVDVLDPSRRPAESWPAAKPEPAAEPEPAAKTHPAPVAHPAAGQPFAASPASASEPGGLRTSPVWRAWRRFLGLAG